MIRRPRIPSSDIHRRRVAMRVSADVVPTGSLHVFRDIQLCSRWMLAARACACGAELSDCDSLGAHDSIRVRAWCLRLSDSNAGLGSRSSSLCGRLRVDLCFGCPVHQRPSQVSASAHCVAALEFMCGQSCPTLLAARLRTEPRHGHHLHSRTGYRPFHEPLGELRLIQRGLPPMTSVTV